MKSVGARYIFYVFQKLHFFNELVIIMFDFIYNFERDKFRFVLFNGEYFYNMFY